MSSYPQFKKYTRRAILGTAIPSAAWAFGIEPDLLSITEKEFSLLDWPGALDGFRIAHLTDLHYRPGSDEELTQKLISAVNEADVDLILITGDFVIKDPSSLPECCRHLKNLRSKHGIIASPGNHDRWYCTSVMLWKELTKAGITYLQNDGSNITIKGEQFFLAGLDSIWGGSIDAHRSWKGHRKGDAVISLMHEPDVFDHLRVDRTLSLQLSGHTHGGQCRVPLIGYAPAKVKYGRNYIYGHFEKNDAQLWVGRGVGTVGVRARFSCKPELTLLTLKSSA
ncbi:metallophosphoesterase [Akkermansiaceae bacterium]|nr:metallophosphoesterase [Akkermansiaceae bacterium]